MSITPLPDAPSRSNPATFATKGDALLGALAQFVTEANALLAQCNLNATTNLSLSAIQYADKLIDSLKTTAGLGYKTPDGSTIKSETGTGLRIVPASDGLPAVVRNAANNADVLVLKPALDATVIAGTSTTEPVTPASLSAKQQAIAIFTYETASGTAGGTATSGSWLDLPLSTERSNGIGAALATPSVTLPAGTYLVDWTSLFFGTGNAITRLVINVDGSPTYIYSVNGYSGAEPRWLSKGNGVFTIGSSLKVKLQYRCTSTNATAGLGSACSFGVNEVYRTLKITKL